MNTTNLVRRSEPSGTWRLTITPQDAGWDWSGLSIAHLSAGEQAGFRTDGVEAVVLPLSGSATVIAGDAAAEPAGRESVFAAVTDFAYVGRGREVVVSSERGGVIAVATARAGRDLPFRYVPADTVPVACSPFFRLML